MMIVEVDKKMAGVARLAIAILFLPLSLQSTQRIQAVDDPLGVLISGKTFERGKKESKYELYKYEAYRSEGCNIQWNETHKFIENGKQILLTNQTLNVGLETLDPASLSNSKYETGRLVSFTTVRLEPRIKARVKTVYEDLTEDSSTGVSSGYGFYLGSNDDAKKLFAELKSRIKSCKS